jgi:hypothetical protein
VRSAALPLLLGALLLPALPGCQPPEVPGQGPTVSMRMQPAKGTPIDAVVIVDDQALGTLELVMAHGVALPPGVHHITVKADGFFPWDREVEAKLGTGILRVDVALMPVPD